MLRRKWTADEITEAVAAELRFPAANLIRPDNSATRYVHPVTGRSVVLDDATGEVIHVGGDDYVY